tara:strand:+ start:2486 stop:2761 length:276 start_codon:yes stop_codon:yes gene_type:complete
MELEVIISRSKNLRSSFVPFATVLASPAKVYSLHSSQCHSSAHPIILITIRVELELASNPFFLRALNGVQGFIKCADAETWKKYRRGLKVL